MTDHKRIWLEPAGAPDRCWSQGNQWGDEGVEYVLAASPTGDDLVETAEALEEFADIDACEGGNPHVIETERRAARMLREAAARIIAVEAERDQALALVNYSEDVSTTIVGRIAVLEAALRGLLRCEYEAAGMGLYDCVDNLGQMYQSADLDKQIKTAEAALTPDPS